MARRPMSAETKAKISASLKARNSGKSGDAKPAAKTAKAPAAAKDTSQTPPRKKRSAGDAAGAPVGTYATARNRAAAGGGRGGTGGPVGVYATARNRRTGR